MLGVQEQALPPERRRARRGAARGLRGGQRGRRLAAPQQQPWPGQQRRLRGGPCCGRALVHAHQCARRRPRRLPQPARRPALGRALGGRQGVQALGQVGRVRVVHARRGQRGHGRLVRAERCAVTAARRGAGAGGRRVRPEVPPSAQVPGVLVVREVLLQAGIDCLRGRAALLRRGATRLCQNPGGATSQPQLRAPP